MFSLVNHNPFPSFASLTPTNLYIKITKVASLIKHLVIQLISSKQSVRPDSMLGNIWEMIPNMKKTLAFQAFAVSQFFYKKLTQENTRYIQALKGIKKLIDKDINLTPAELSSLKAIIASAKQDRNYLNKFDLIVLYQKNNGFSEAHKALQFVLKTNDQASYSTLKLKIEGVINAIHNEQSLDDKDKLMAEDFQYLLTAVSKVTLINDLRGLGIIGLDDMHSRWQELATYSLNPELERLKLACQENLTDGCKIFLGNRHIAQVFNGPPFGVHDIFEYVVRGKLCHMGILIPKQDAIHISHANIGTKNHAVHPLRSPLLPFLHYSCELDINALLPTNVTADHRNILTQYFTEQFHQLASTPHPELPLVPRSFLQMLFYSHTSITTQKLSSIQLPAANTPIRCDIYVGTIFLMAIKKVNEKLTELGYKEQIPHPFGKHEDLQKMDILRLIYLWKKIKVIKKCDLHPLISKVLSMPAPLPCLD